MKPGMCILLAGMVGICASSPIARGQCEITEDQILIESGETTFGSEVAIDGDTLVVGGRDHLYVYRRGAAGWEAEATIPVPGLRSSWVETTIDISGDRIIAAAGRNALPEHPDKAFIFHREQGVWTQKAAISRAVAAGEFATAVSISGDAAAVATADVNVGAALAYLFRWNGAEWVEEDSIHCTDIAQGAAYRDIALDGDALVVADASYCLGYIVPRSPNPARLSCFGGAARVYRQDGGSWQPEADLNEVLNSECIGGLGAAIHGDAILLGAQQFLDESQFTGVLFRGGPNGWSREATLVPSEPVTPASVVNIIQVAMDDGRAVISWPTNDNPLTNSGRAFVFDETQPGQWTQVAMLAAISPAEGDRLGEGLAVQRPFVVLGQVSSLTDASSAYTFDLSDCNGSGLPDQCPMDCDSDSLCADCNGNGIGDGCDVDCDGNSVPDDCECVAAAPVAAEPDGVSKSRYISFVPPSACQRSAIRVTLRSLHHPQPANLPCCPGPDFSSFEAGPGCVEGPEGCVRWVGPPGVYVDSVNAGTSFDGAMLQCEPFYHDWTGIDVLHVTGPEVAPSSLYEVQLIDQGCDEGEASSFSSMLEVATARWADVAAPFQDPQAPAPPTQPNVIDIGTAVDKLKDAPGAASRVQAQLSPRTINLASGISVIEVGQTVDAVKGFAYPYAGPTTCGP